MVNFPINLRCYVLLGCRVINVILAINIGDSAFFDIAALVRQFGGLRHHQQTESIHWPPPPKPKSWLRHCYHRLLPVSAAGVGLATAAAGLVLLRRVYSLFHRLLVGRLLRALRGVPAARPLHDLHHPNGLQLPSSGVDVSPVSEQPFSTYWRSNCQDLASGCPSRG